MNIGEASVSTVKGIVGGVKAIGGDTVEATTTAVKTVLTVSQEFGEETLKQVKGSLTESVDEAKAIIAEFEAKK